jgi:hypothetical protein
VVVIDVISEGPAQSARRSNRESQAAALYVGGLD